MRAISSAETVGEAANPHWPLAMNFRWNESPVRIMQKTQKLGQPVRNQGGEGGFSIVPPLVAADFNLVSVSDAV